MPPHPSLFHFTPRPGTCDANVFHDVVEKNEYQLPDSFGADDLIVDIGGHVGSFTRACLDRGAGCVRIYEASWENCERIIRHLGLKSPHRSDHAYRFERSEGGRFQVDLHHRAVWRSDREVDRLAFGGFVYDANADEVNTGGGAVFELQGHASKGVRAIPLLEVLRKDPLISLLKLDCEGSEWPILYSLPDPAADLLGVQKIVGEFHNRDEPEDPWPWMTNSEGLVSFLMAAGFTSVSTRDTDLENGLGLFWASR